MAYDRYAVEVTDKNGQIYGVMDAETREEVSKLNSAFTSETVFREALNMYDSTGDVVGVLYSNGNINPTGTSYKTTAPIQIKAGISYTISPALRSHAFYSDIRANSSCLVAFDGESKTSPYTFTASSDGYMRISFPISTPLTTIVSSFSGTPTKKIEEDISLSGYQKLQVEDIVDEKGFIPKENINIYDGSGDVVGVLYSNGGIDVTGTLYKTTAPVRIKAGFTYIISPRIRKRAIYSNISANSSCLVAYYDESTTTPCIFTASADGYMRVSFANEYPLTSIASSFSGMPTKKVEESIALNNTQIQQVGDMIAGVDVLYGKKWAVCGDSFTNDGGTGTRMPAGTKYEGHSYTYPWIIGSRQNMDIVQFFMGGRTLAFPANPGEFVNSLTNPNATWYYQNIPSDVDYITIYLGINDEHHAPGSSGGDGEDNTGEIPIGTISDNTTATYLGAWNVVLTWLVSNRPNAHIGIIVTNGIQSNNNYRLGQIAIAEKYGIPYIDLNGDSRTPAMLRTSNPNIPAAIKEALIQKWAVDPSGNTHPNDAAQLFESTVIENFLRSI